MILMTDQNGSVTISLLPGEHMFLATSNDGPNIEVKKDQTGLLTMSVSSEETDMQMIEENNILTFSFFTP